MYDPMVAKLIVWDSDREAATARMLRALDEYEVGGVTTLIPFHKALLATKQWHNAETCRDLVEDAKWLKSLAPRSRRRPPPPRNRRTTRSSATTRSRSTAAGSRSKLSARRPRAAR